MKHISLLLTFILIATIAVGRARTIKITANHKATIFVNGSPVGQGAAEVRIQGGETVSVRVEKEGYIPQERVYTNEGRKTIPKTDFFDLEVDEAYQSSSTTDVANNEIEIKTNLPEDEAWKRITRLVTDHFDIIEVTDKTTGYLRTAWVTKRFKSGIVRTRFIVKTSTSSPLSYKVKLMSEVARGDVSVKQDESFKEWDRVLRAYANIIQELQSRMAN